jgi:cytochrome c oxidase cbb3-type subunit 3
MLGIRLMLAGVIVMCGCRGPVRTDPTSRLPGSITTAMIAQGDSIFHARACRRCHGPRGQGTVNGPVLADTVWLHIGGSYAEIVQLITRGVSREELRDTSRPFDMQPRGGRNNPLTDEQIRLVAAYVYSLSRHKAVREDHAASR